MLTELQMEMVDHIFQKMKEMIFATGSVPQAYCVTRGNHALMYPMPFDVASSVGVEIAQKFAEMEGSELVIFISEVWSVQRVVEKDKMGEVTDDNWQQKAQEALGEGSPGQQEDKSEALMMMVLEVASKQVHMKLGSIKRDSEGGAYIDEDEWMPDGDLSDYRTSFFPTFNA